MRYCLALDLKDDPALIAEYEHYHEKIWPEIEESIRLSGITDMEIYRIGPRLFMIMETDETFSFDQKGAADAANPKVTGMGNADVGLPTGATHGETRRKMATHGSYF